MGRAVMLLGGGFAFLGAGCGRNDPAEAPDRGAVESIQVLENASLYGAIEPDRSAGGSGQTLSAPLLLDPAIGAPRQDAPAALPLSAL